ncbi:GyrI-like domain-containing protein [Desnuesiella massiliensis]|uniref:GyrI-like domain-containing protein n=1 Tax=Desnuesiella massiliensis TaxID=1650662 RepID=UPI0006E172FF|nr:GyrI-like domain-containing protein [Desnuesiella massiliensis]
MEDKRDYKKIFKELYSQSEKEISILEVPRFNYLMIKGNGNPNTSKEYEDAVQALFSVSYGIKFMIKKSELKINYGVMPLEGLWWTEDMKDFSIYNKDIWKWCAMIMQPDVVTENYVSKALDEIAKKKQLNSLSKIEYKEHEEGIVAQIMHIGPYADEAPTIERLHSFIDGKGYKLKGLHHEIYLNDPRKCAPEKMKTIIRQPIEKI